MDTLYHVQCIDDGAGSDEIDRIEADSPDDAAAQVLAGFYERHPDDAKSGYEYQFLVWPDDGERCDAKTVFVSVADIAS